MKIIEAIADLRQVRQMIRGKVGLVPTMGYLHAGHLSLVQEARRDCDFVFVSIFVNPTQFAASEDLDAYPRDLPRDLAMLEAAGVDAVFLPTPAMMYPQGYQTYITVEQVAQGKEGGSRPGHFRGVATVVAKLFLLFQPDMAYFGQKDAQQVAVLRRMVADLNFLIDLIVCPIVREHDGLAMSSRNVYLKPQERQAAAVLYRSMQDASALYEAGERDPAIIRQAVMRVLEMEPLAQVDYVSMADAATLEEIAYSQQEPVLLSLAVRIGQPRLLDNCLLPLALNDRDGATSTLGISPEER